jgi:hypothetical protein
LDDKEYPAALALCLNYIPNQEGSLSPRSGFRRCGLTKNGAPAKLLPFRFDYYSPYVAEHTSGNLRFWANGLPQLCAVYAIIISVAGDPPVFTVRDSRSLVNLVPPEWDDGDSIIIKVQALDVETQTNLIQREFIISIPSSTTITLTDAETGVPLTGTVTFTADMAMYRIIDLLTPYDAVNSIRQVAFTSQTLVTSTNTAVDVVTGPEHKVSFLQSVICPRSISYNLGLEYKDPARTYAMIREEFIDGPYLDSLGPEVPLTVSGTTGIITVTLYGWSALATYYIGDIVTSGTSFFVSLIDLNINHALPASINGFWAKLPALGWSSIISYDLGVVLYYLPKTGDLGTVYYSQIPANLNQNPTTDPDWSTTPPAWDILATYPAYAVVTDVGIRYLSISVPVVGTAPAAAPAVWFPISDTFFEDAFASIDGPTGYTNVVKFISLTDAGDSPVDGPGRLIRLKAGPQPWHADIAYIANDLVNFKDNIYMALGATIGDIPDQEPAAWELQSKTILWTWGQIVGVTGPFTASVLIKGDDLPNTDPVWEWRLGLYSDSTGWPHCGTYHEGRLCFSGPITNRIDFGRTNLGYDFTPTAPDGTVADNNAISYVLNSREDERIHALASTAEGIVVLTSEREWLVSASNVSDPLTPTSIQAHPTTGFSATDVEACVLPSGIAFIQSGRRRLMEHRSFVDVSNYQARMNAIDLTRKCQHLTGDGIIEAQYQRIPQPVIWCLPGGLVETTEQPDICPAPGTYIQQENQEARLSLFGLGYSRTPDLNYVAPFSYEHGIDLLGDERTTLTSIAVQRGYMDTAEYLYMAMVRSESAITYIEMLMPTFEGYPLEDALSGTGTVVRFGNLASAYFLDSGITPLGVKIATNGLSATFYGLHPHAGAEVSFTIMGKYVGDYTIASDGSVNVLFNAAFTKIDIGRACVENLPNSTLIPNFFQMFRLDVNGNTGVPEPNPGAGAYQWFYGQFGLKYRRRLQTLRPSAPGASGPAFAKIRRNHSMGVYVDTAQEVSIGDTFNTLFALNLLVPRTDGKDGTEAATITEFVTGIYRDEVTSDHTYDGGLCVEQTRPVPGGILAVGGFEELTDS